MQIIISHVNTDFDALASMIAAKKLYPKAQIVISNQQDLRVRQFLNMYRDTFSFVYDHEVDWSLVSHLIMVDIASLSRVGNFAKEIEEAKVRITVYDHHPRKTKDVVKDDGIIESVGATVTLLLEEIKKRSLPITPLEATLFGLGIYTDTGSFTYKNTNERDFAMACFLMKKGMNLELITQFSEQTLRPELQSLLNHLFTEASTHEIEGLKIVVSTYYHRKVLGGLALVAEKMLEIKDVDAVLIVVGMRNNVFIVGRARSERISLTPLLKKWGGGGHKHAGSATIKKADYMDVCQKVEDQLSVMIQPAITAKDIMSYPVKTIKPDTTIDEAGHLMYRYGHSGYPVVENNKLLGVITRRDLDKASYHGLGHAPVKAYMSTELITISPTTTIEEIQSIVSKQNIGRLPVVKRDALVGIISRTDLIRTLHKLKFSETDEKPFSLTYESKTLQKQMQKHLPARIYKVLRKIGQVAERSKIKVYLVGGIVRDLFLNIPNEDVDLVVEGDGIQFAYDLQEAYGGELVTYSSFGTATWKYSKHVHIDIASARIEYYEEPGALPQVEKSMLEEDLSRRDFTINAMAVCLNEKDFGLLIDPFDGEEDLKKKTLKVLHNLSFVEDPTRIFRALRFEARFNFKMDEQKKRLARHSIGKMKELSADRILENIELLFLESPPKWAIKRLFKVAFWQQFGVEEEHLKKSLHHLKNLMKQVSKERDLFYYFLIPFYQARQWKSIEKFALKRKHRKSLQEIKALDQHSMESVTKIDELHRLLKDYSDEAIQFIFTGKSFPSNTLWKMYLEKRKTIPVYLTGKDLLEQGVQTGRIYSQFFLELEGKILSGDIHSKEDALEFLKHFLASNR